MHGTRQMPERFFDVICITSESKIKIAIEAPSELTHHIQNFINTSNISSHSTELLKLNFGVKITKMEDQVLQCLSCLNDEEKQDELMASTFKKSYRYSLSNFSACWQYP
jgi:hypothetical protein